MFPRKAFSLFLPYFLALDTYAATKLSLKETDRLIRASLAYLKATQVKETVSIERFKGEWLSQMGLDKDFVLLGKAGKAADDSNLFTTVSIYNILAEYYEKHPEFEEIAPMLEGAMENILRYKHPTRHSFGFWQYFPKRRAIWTKEERKTGNISLIRRSNNFDIEMKISNKAENVPDDADDTAQAHVAMFRHRSLANRQLLKPLDFQYEKIAPMFDAFLDLDRKSIPNVYNWRSRGFKHTGAYLTWFAHENRSLYLAFPHLDTVYLPLGLNDVDCVVNANVLAALEMYNERADSSGAPAACRYLRKVIRKKRAKVCGMYYPNWFNFHYNMSKAQSMGVHCVDEELPILVQDLLSNQTKKGSWSSYTIDSRRERDEIQATVYALNALLRLGDLSDTNVDEAVQRAFTFLLSKANDSGESTYWQGGIFFTGGTIVRKTAAWRSSAYTTALVLEALASYSHLLGGEP
ncbi:MAG: hypothetical protein HYW48_04105 [Deltaproteobacteria bacterium]|nr:hypothetical protein [Deltaproteobacteria bacterium]